MFFDSINIVQVIMGNNWLSEFGFTKNPYDTMALPASVEGDALLVGRDEEVNFLIQQLTSSSLIPLLYGENGVGKSSIANVAAFRLSQKHSQGNTRYFSLKMKSIQGNQLADLAGFERSIYQEILFLLLDNRKFLERRNIKKREIIKVNKLIRQLGNIGGGGGVGLVSLNIDYVPNPFAENSLPSIARSWLEKCFSGCYSGGIICVIDNLENNGTSSQVKKSVESLRDTLFTMPGLLWVFCGTPIAVEGMRTSRLLQGYLAEKRIYPIEDSLVPTVVERRIAFYGNVNVDPPIDKDLFETLYTIVNKQLRVAFTLCQEFATFLFNNPVWRHNSRKSEFKTWIDQMASDLPEREYEIPNESWQLFEKIITFGSDISSNDLELLGLSDVEELNRLALPLKFHRLLEIVETDDGFVVRITRDGWLVNYKRHNYGAEESVW